MANYKLRPWPFNPEEEVEIYWICSPFLLRSKGWMVKVVFFNSKRHRKEVIMPWGNLPALRLGQKYVDGVLVPDKYNGVPGKIVLRDTTEYSICEAFDMPIHLYNFFSKKEYGTQQVCMFSLNNNIYYIPCVELIRSYLAPYKVLANNLLKPNGLDNIIPHGFIKKDILEMEITDEIPRRIVSDDTAKYLAWLRYDKEAYHMWNSVYENIYNDAVENSPKDIKNEFIKEQLLRIYPPRYKKYIWKFRGVSFYNCTLILELIHKSNLNMPFKLIEYHHPSMTVNKKSSQSKTKQYINSGNSKTEGYKADESGDSAKKDNDQPVAALPPVSFSFIKDPIMVMRRKSSRKIRSGIPEEDAIIVPSSIGNDEGKKEVKTTAQEWTQDGKIQPIEFKMLEIVKDNYQGLEQFIKMIQYIIKAYKNLSISLSIIYLPEGKSFSRYPSGERRTCAVARISDGINMPTYIIELGRKDGWSISTLVIKLRLKEEIIFMEKYIIEVLTNLIKNNGHWNSCLLTSGYYNYSLLKHLQKNDYFRWAERLKIRI